MNKNILISACEAQATMYYDKIVDKLEVKDLHNQDFFKNQKLYNLYTIMAEMAKQLPDEVKFTQLTQEAVEHYVTCENKARIKYAFQDGDNVLELMVKYPNLSMNDLIKKINKAGFNLVGGRVTK